MRLTIEGLDKFSSEDQILVWRGFDSATKNYSNSLTFNISPTPDGLGITGTVQVENCSVLLSSGEEWRGPGKLERIVRDWLDGATQPNSTERKLLGGKHDDPTQ
jgi:hypothetical protein